MKEKFIESLLSIGGKKNGDKSIDLLSAGLVVKCKDTGHKYTVKSVSFDEGKPSVKCYRFYGSKPEEVVHITLYEKDFSRYEAA